ncbi:MAG TPA: transposase, partial [Anaerolineales bacterium]|nr:transposase [Anaerolineales bacterium]
MGRRVQKPDDLRTRLGEIAGWQTATRDDRQVAQELHATRAIERVHALDEAAFFDEFFHYLKSIEVWPLLERLDPAKRLGPLYPFVQLILFTLMRCVGGVQSLLATHDLLLTDEALMGVLGFNAYQVEHGATARGLGQRTQPLGVRGPFSYETVADNLVAISPAALVELFNGAVRCLARQGVFAKHLDVVLDATDDEATPTYQTDDGRPVPRVLREKRPEVRANRHAQKVEVTVYGWKLWIVWEPQSKIPLAMTIDDIQESDNQHAYAVLAQARKNIEGYATIRSVALDRGFLDGKLLAAIEADGILIYIPAKSNMTVTQEARSIARRAAAAAAQGRSVEGCVYRERHDTVTRGSGQKARTETRTTTLVGIGELPCDWWTPHGSSSQAHRKDFLPKLVRATVVL